MAKKKRSSTWRGSFPAPSGGDYVDPTFITEYLAYLLWWFAYDVNNSVSQDFKADHEQQCYMPYVYAALQHYQWLDNGPWVAGEESPSREEEARWVEESFEEEEKYTWLRRVADFLPWLWD